MGVLEERVGLLSAYKGLKLCSSSEVKFSLCQFIKCL